MKGKPSKRRLLILIFAVVLFLAGVTVSDFMGNVQKDERAIAENNLKVSSNNCAYQVRLAVNSYFNMLSSTAVLLQDMPNLREETLMDRLHTVAAENKVTRLSVDFMDGSRYTSDGYALKVTDADLLERIQAGKPFITNVTDSPIDSAPMIGLYTPIKDKTGTAFAALHLSIKTEEFAEKISLSLFDSEGYFHVIDSSGAYVARGNAGDHFMGDNFMEDVQKLQFKQGFSAEQILYAFTSGHAGFSQYSKNGTDCYAYYQPVGVNQWVLVTVVPNEIIVRQEQRNIYQAITMTLRLGFLFLIVCAYVACIQLRAKRDADLNDQCFRALAEQAGKVIFQWDFSKNMMVSTTKFQENFGREADTHSGAEDAIQTNAVHPDDADVYRGVFEAVFRGENIDGVNYRVKHHDGTYHWCRLSGVVVKNQRGKPYKAICSLEDINERIKKVEDLTLKSQRDQLTGLYNKHTTEMLIRSALKDPHLGSCALILIDIDNFKLVNDSLGHQRGDLLLSQLSGFLTPLFRQSDIVGRIGGDEFFVFIRDYGQLELVLEKSEKICNLFRSLDVDGTHVSASLGISLFPEHSRTFEELYKFADLALYATKKKGKNHFTLYDGSQTDAGQDRTAIEH